MARAGSRTLSIFTNELSARVLRAHGDGPVRSGELEEMLGWAPQSSLRAVVAKMCDVGALARVEPGGELPSTATKMTEAGRELLPIADALERWLQVSPAGPIALDDIAAHAIIKILTVGWDSTMIRALAEQPLTLVELSTKISSLNYPALKRRLTKLRSIELVVPVKTSAGTAYKAGDWLHLAAIPLVLAGSWEHRHDPGAEPVSALEVEAAFLLSLPLIELQGNVTGTCALAVALTEDHVGSGQKVAGLKVEAEHGRLASLSATSTLDQPTWALGTVEAWFDAVIAGNHQALRIGGAKPRMAKGIVAALHADLFQAS